VWEQRLTEVGKGMVSSRLNAHLPNRLADALAREAGVEDRRMSELRKTERMHLLQLITEYELQYTGHQGYKKAEVRMRPTSVRVSDKPIMHACRLLLSRGEDFWLQAQQQTCCGQCDGPFASVHHGKRTRRCRISNP
jgi:hypothetical protein